MSLFPRDLRHASRMLARNPGFGLVAILTLALGIGANTSIFSVVNAVLLRPLPYADPDRLAWVAESFPQGGGAFVPSTDYMVWRADNKVFAGMAAWSGGDLNLTGDGEPERVPGARVTASFLPLLGVRPEIGRNFTAEEDRPGGAPVVLLSHSLWMRRLGGRRDVIGRQVVLDGTAHAVIGVMPASFQFPAALKCDLIVPAALPEQTSAGMGDRIALVNVVARLKPAINTERALSDLKTMDARVMTGTPGMFRAMRAHIQFQVVPLHRKLVGNARPVLLVLLGAVAFVLLIACANVANLQLARAATRQKEIAVRAALGAGRLRLARQLFVESLLLSSLGGSAGFLAALVSTDLVRALVPSEILHPENIRVDFQVFLFTLGVAVLTGLLFGLAPALTATRPDLNETLKEGSTRLSRSHTRIRSFLVVSELAMAVVLLLGSGLLIRSFVRLMSVEPGFTTSNLLTVRVVLPMNKYETPQQQISFFQQVLDRLRSVPGVHAASAATHLPLTEVTMMLIIGGVEGHPPVPPDQRAPVPLSSVSTDYFRTMGMRLLSGRSFTSADAGGTPQVAVVNQSFARRYFPNESPLGKHILGGPPGTPGIQIVGIVNDVRDLGLEKDPSPEIFSPFAQSPIPLMTFAVRTTGNPVAIVPAIRSQILAVDKDQPIDSVATMEERLSESVAARRLNMVLIGVFAALALLLAAVGIYGVVSYWVSQSTHEIGIRMALGAARADVLRLVIGDAAILTAYGLVLGIIGSLVLARFVGSFLFGVHPSDPPTFFAVSALLAAVALLASYIPARRATRVDPMVALRYE